MDISASILIIITGALAASSCGLLGSFLILRKMSLLGDAISHAVLPGIAIAFLITASRDIAAMIIGAAGMGLLAVFLIETLHKKWRVQEDASIGIIYTALFALGVILISAYAGQIDLDQECVLYGEIAYTPWDTMVVGGANLGPRPIWLLGVVFLLDVLFVALFYKELKISSFDPGLAAALGFNVSLIHYSFMAAVSLTTVAAFESVGAILVVAMLIVPGATAYLWTDRLSHMLLLSVLFGALSSAAGYLLAGLWDSSIAGAMTVAAGGFFTLSILLSPKYGLAGRLWNQFRLGVKFASDHLLLSLYRARENENRIFVPIAELYKTTSTMRIQADLAIRKARRNGDVVVKNGELLLTPQGGQAAAALIQGHRLWEDLADRELGLPADHVHEAAHRVEHFIDQAMLDELQGEGAGIHVTNHNLIIPGHDALVMGRFPLIAKEVVQTH